MQVTKSPQPHRARGAALLKRRPELAEHFGASRWTRWILFGLLALQLGVAGLVAQGAWWWTVVAAWCVGAFVSHALYAIIHECSHQLVVRGRTRSRVLGIVANLALGVPMAITYMHFHIQHHLHQGAIGRDPDLPLPFEERIAGRSVLGKLLWQASFAFLQTVRLANVRRAPDHVRRWVLVNVVVQLMFDVVLVLVLGPKALLFVLLSFYFTTAWHPLSGRFVQEHHTVFGNQETTSYYGLGNLVAMNIGYHNEHHDFPFVAWDRLPALARALSSEPEYAALESHRSWTRLWFSFLFDPDLGPDRRIAR